MATGLRSFSLAVAVVASVAVLAGATISGSASHAQDNNPDTSETGDTSAQLTEEALIARGNELLEAGDFASARLLYQAAAHHGSGKAAMLTGVTFDPRYRELAGVSGPRSNAKLARQWYALAMEMGDDQARRNDRDLAQWLEEQSADPEAVASTEDETPAPNDQGAPMSAARTHTQPPEETPEPEPRPETAAQAMPAEAPGTVDQAPPVPIARPETQPPEGMPEPEPRPETAVQAMPAEAPGTVDQAPPVPIARPDTEQPEETPEPEPNAETADQAVSEPAPSVNAAPSPIDARPSAFDARIVRAQLTSAVNDREPVDRLPSSIEVSGGRVDRIVFFSEVRGLAGHGLSHRWEREGQTMADVSFSVGGDTWRMHSSKRVTAAMTGTWRVVVVDKGGAELASVPFVLE